MDHDVTVCLICYRPLWADEIEAGRFTGLDCQKQGVEKLRALPRLYRATEHALQPGRSGDNGGPVSGSRSAPLPCREAALDLRAVGGMADEIAQWEDCVRSELTFEPRPGRGGLETTLGGSVTFLAQNAPWIWASFVAVDDLHRDIARWHGVATRLIDGDRPERQIPVACKCGTIIRLTLSTDGHRCTCGTQYGRAELRQLPLVERSAA